MAATKKATTRKAGESPSERARRVGPPTYDRLKKKKARTRTVPIVLDDDLAADYEAARKRADKLRLFMAKVRGNGGSDPGKQAELDQAEAERDRLKAELDEETMTLKFRAVGRKRYEALLQEHPPSKEDVEEAKKKREAGEQVGIPEFDGDTFPPALVAISCVEPAGLDEDSYYDEDRKQTRYPRTEEIFEEWNTSELTAIFIAALEANTQRRVVDLGEG